MSPSRGWTPIHTQANGSGTITDIYAYGPYGEPVVKDLYDPNVATKSFSGSRFRYTGQTVLPEAQLYYYKARVYDPIHGRFLQTDPIGSEDDLNLYAYTGGDPINGTDPTGEKCELTGNEDAPIRCTVDNRDDYKDNLDAMNDIARIEAAYTRAVTAMYKNPETTAKVEYRGESFIARAGDVQQALMVTRLNYAKNEVGNRAETLGGGQTPDFDAIITVNSIATHTDRTGNTFNIDDDLASTIVHEGIHLLPGEGVFFEKEYFKMRDFNNEHKKDYNKASDILWGRVR